MNQGAQRTAFCNSYKLKTTCKFTDSGERGAARHPRSKSQSGHSTNCTYSPGQAPGMDAAVSLAHRNAVQCGQYKGRRKIREATGSCP